MTHTQLSSKARTRLQNPSLADPLHFWSAAEVVFGGGQRHLWLMQGFWAIPVGGSSVFRSCLGGGFGLLKARLLQLQPLKFDRERLDSSKLAEVKIHVSSIYLAMNTGHWYLKGHHPISLWAGPPNLRFLADFWLVVGLQAIAHIATHHVARWQLLFVAERASVHLVDDDTKRFKTSACKRYQQHMFRAMIKSF